MILFGQLFYSFAFTFICCELGERVRKAFVSIENDVDQFSWYLFPFGIWKMLPMFMAAAEEPVILWGIESMPCTREYFQQVSP